MSKRTEIEGLGTLEYTPDLKSWSIITEKGGAFYRLGVMMNDTGLSWPTLTAIVNKAMKEKSDG